MQPEASQAETIITEDIEEIVKGLREQVVVNDELINEALDEQDVIENQMIATQEATNHRHQDLGLKESIVEGKCTGDCAAPGIDGVQGNEERLEASEEAISRQPRNAHEDIGHTLARGRVDARRVQTVEGGIEH